MKSFIENILSYGMIAGLLIIIVRAAVYLFDVDLTNVSFLVLNFVYNLIVLSICPYLGTIAWRKKITTGNLTYGKGLLVCIVIGFVAILLVYVYDFSLYAFIAPDYLTNMLAPQLTAIANNPSIPPMQKMMLMEKMQKYASPWYFTAINALMFFGISVIISLIIAIVTVKNRLVIIEETN